MSLTVNTLAREGMRVRGVQSLPGIHRARNIILILENPRADLTFLFTVA